MAKIAYIPTIPEKFINNNKCCDCYDDNFKKYVRLLEDSNLLMSPRGVIYGRYHCREMWNCCNNWNVHPFLFDNKESYSVRLRLN